MSITWTLDNDSRQYFGPSGIVQPARATFSASDYTTGGYSVFAYNFALSSLKGLIPVGYSKFGSGAPGGTVWQFQIPAVAGPALTNPGHLLAMRQNGSTGPLVETASNTDFSGGTIDFLAYGY